MRGSPCCFKVKKTKIDWCDSSINFFTGCNHGCDFCYARDIATRFDGKINPESVSVNIVKAQDGSEIYDLAQPIYKDGRRVPYPFGFAPTFHRYLLEQPSRWSKGRNIFVGSMCDMFGEWVPDEWILSVFEACKAASQHTYLFLTKNPKRYKELADRDLLPRANNMWYGSSITKGDDDFFYSIRHHCFLSIEPLLENIGICENIDVEWVIIGAETGNRKEKVIPQKVWIDNIVESCRRESIPLFMKSSLREIMGDEFVQKYPKYFQKN